MSFGGRVRMGGRPLDGSPDATPEAARTRPWPGALRVLNSAELLAGADEVVIAHNGDAYRLRRTSNGKLILTK